MIKNYLENPFTKLDLSDKQVYNFIAEHIVLLEQANINNNYSEIIEETKLNLEKFTECINKPKVKNKDKKSIEELHSNIHKFIKHLSKEIKAVLKQNVDLTKDFELKDKNKTNKNNINLTIDYLKRIEKNIVKHETLFEKQTFLSLKELLVNIKTWEKAEQKKVEKKLYYKTFKIELLQLMYLNLLKLILHNINNIEDVNLLYPSAFLNGNKKLK